MNVLKLLFIIGAVVCFPLYGFLSVTQLNLETGFFYPGSPLTYVLYGFLFAIPLLMIIISLIKKDKFDFTISNSKVLGIFAILIALLLTAKGVLGIVNIVGLLSTVSIFDIVPSSLLLFFLQIPIILLSAFVFFKLGISYFKESISNRGSMTFIFPVIWALVTCVQIFQDYPQIAGMPERTLYLLFLLSFTLFLLGHTRIMGNVDVPKGIRWSAVFGFSAALFGLTMTVGEGAAFANMTLPLFDVALVAVLSLYCLFFVINTEIKK